MALANLQWVLAEALPQRDPKEALRNLATRALTTQESDSIARLPEDGLLLTSLVLIKLRLQQLLKSSAEAARMFENTPEEFVGIFGEYQAECPMADFFPQGEAARFANWLQSRQVIVASLNRDG